ncbi:uncharacterized protein [Periplaneta americana]|uniref:uncharacterized protein n=1 Tax=Periplaneta americana TaxID=6978 RepID=UPI0037E8D15E
MEPNCGPISSILLATLFLLGCASAENEEWNQSPLNEIMTTTAMTTTTAFSSKPNCEASKTLRACLEQLPPILDQAEMTGIPSSKKDVEASCSAFKTGMGCIDEYSKNCLKPNDKKILEDHVAGARYTFRFLCDDAGFQSEYLMYKTCYRGVSKDWDACASRFVQLVREEMSRKNVSETSRLMELCCAKHGFLRCVYAASRYKCRKEEALFLKKIAETLSDMRVYSPHCKNVDMQLCSGGNVHHSLAMLLKFALLILIASFSSKC